MRLIPGKTNVKIEIFKGISIADAVIGAMGLALAVLLAFSTIPYRFLFAFLVILIFIGLLFRVDEEPNYLFFLRVIKHVGMNKHYQKVVDDKMLVKTSKKRDKDAIFNDMLKIYNDEDLESAESEDDELEFDNLEDNGTKEGASKNSKEGKHGNKVKSDKSGKPDKTGKSSKNGNKSKKSSAAKELGESLRDYNDIKDIIPFTGIKSGFIDYNGQYYGAAVEIEPVEFRFLSPGRKKNTIENGIGQILRNINANYATNIIKLDRPVNYESFLKKEYEKVDQLKKCYESGLISEDEMQPRIEILYEHINKLIGMIKEDPVITPFYYLVIYDSDRKQLELQLNNIYECLKRGEIGYHRLNSTELALFLKYSNEIDFDENTIKELTEEQYADFAMPDQIDIKSKMVSVNGITTHNFRISGYPFMVGDAWLASVMSMPSTKVVIKCTPLERYKSVKQIDKSLQELRVQLRATSLDSKALEIQEHIESLEQLLATLQSESETLLRVNIYITAYDINESNKSKADEDKIKSNRVNINNLRKIIRRLYRENNLKLVSDDFQQIETFVGTQISGYDPYFKQGRGIPSNSVAACYPWIFPSVSDIGGIEMGTSDGVPVFMNFFRRDYERLNSNMVIVGKSGSGKSYATKDILSNLAADNCKIFILDPENEYSDLANNLHGKFINVGNAKQGRINPFQVITLLDDEEDEGGITGSYATHLQFLEEFFKQILPDCDRDALEYLNTLVDRMYYNAGIDEETDLSKLKPEDYPIFDDLYDSILEEFQHTDNEYIRNNLRTLMNYVAKFSAGGRNANIWNGPSTITTDENFVVFNFQSLLSNRNSLIANAQMLLILKYIDNEIIKNRDYNIKYRLDRKIVVAIDEAHVFIDNKFPIALDFMFQLAKRIRKYNGMQIVITQNIKDFVGSEEIARKSSAIINACQYSLIFALAPNDMHDLCKLYEKAGGINEVEQDNIANAARGQAFTVLSPTSRTTFKVEVPENIVRLFESKEYESQYFAGVDGAKQWEDFIGESRLVRIAKTSVREIAEDMAKEEKNAKKPKFIFSEISDEENEKSEKINKTKAAKSARRHEKIIEPEQIGESEDIRETEQISEPEDIREYEQIIEPEDIRESEQIGESEDIIEPEQIDEPEDIQIGEPEGAKSGDYYEGEDKVDTADDDFDISSLFDDFLLSDDEEEESDYRNTDESTTEFRYTDNSTSDYRRTDNVRSFRMDINSDARSDSMMSSMKDLHADSENDSSEVSRIEQMKTNGEKVIDITWEELTIYLKSVK